MESTATVFVRMRPSTKREVEALKLVPRESLDDVIRRLLAERREKAQEGRSAS